MFRSIRWRISIPYVALILLTMLGLAIYLSNFIRQAHLNDLRVQLTSEARLLGNDFSPIMAQGADPNTLNALVKNWSAVSGTRVTLIAVDGKVLADSQADITTMDNHLNRPEVQQALSAGQGNSIRFSQTLGYDLMYAAVQVLDKGKVIGVARVALPAQQIESTIASLQRTLLVTSLVVTLLAMLLALLIAEATTRPLRYLTQTANQITISELDKTMIPTTQDEVGELAKAFNSMTSNLSEQVKALKYESSKLATVLRNMTDGVLIVDAQGRVQLLNPTAERLFGVSENNALGRSLAEVVRQYQLVDLWQNCQKSGETQEISLELIPQHIFIQSIATLLGQAMPGSILILIQDLTRLRQLEIIRRDFFSNISHELRTPITSIKALSETLQETALEDPVAAREFLQRLDTEVDALAQVISEMLELSRIDSGQVPLNFQSTSPSELLNSAVERLRLQAERKGIQLRVECPDTIPTALTDPPRMQQVFVNLLHNAIKFTPAGGTITLAAYEQDGNILFSVKDTGVGISKDDLPRIFERFYKVDRSRTGTGTGLGLAIARHMVEAHGGRIWAESVEGQGSTFYISLPQFNK